MVSLNTVKKEVSELTEEEQDNLAAYLTVIRLKRTQTHADKLSDKLNNSKQSDWENFDDIK
ncbi:MAG: hypothetical protein NE327_15520 [Lentisphaeraceae bacterium]|nr:hypothetical protein [Lentisphaeraceae bacterium]